MIGLPGSGKSTFISTYLSHLPVVSRDIIRTKMGIEGIKPQGTPEQEKMVSFLEVAKIVEHCKNKESFVIDNTNLKLSYRNNFKKIMEEYNPKIVYVVVETSSFDENVKRRDGLIPLEVMERMRNNFAYPTEDEYDEIIINRNK